MLVFPVNHSSKPGILIIYLVINVLLLGCAASSPQREIELSDHISIEVFKRSDHCGSYTQETTSWISAASRLQEVIKNSSAQTPEQPLSFIKDIDFSNYGVLFIAMGQKRTGGYGLKLIEESFAIDNDTAELVVHWQEPKPGYMVTQVLTNPCLFVKIPKGGFSQLRLKDQRGNVRAQLQVN